MWRKYKGYHRYKTQSEGSIYSSKQYVNGLWIYIQTKLLEGEGSESSEGIIDSRLSNKQNDDDAIIVV
jgi:hypothetical protein